LFKSLAKTSWGRKLLIPVTIGACAWSQFTYLFFGVPKDKKALYDNFVGWEEAEMEPHWQSLINAESEFHELKNVLVEWTRFNAQPAAKGGSLLLVLGWTGCFIFALLFLLSYWGWLQQLISTI
jgi:hypothetical protein